MVTIRLAFDDNLKIAVSKNNECNFKVLRASSKVNEAIFHSSIVVMKQLRPQLMNENN